MIKTKINLSLASESVQSASLSLKCIYDIESCDSLSAGVLSVCDGITYNVFKEYLKYSTGLVVD